MFFLPLPLVLAEILIFTTWVHFYDFWTVFLAYLAPSFLGALLLSQSGQHMARVLRNGVVPGQMPGNTLLHQGARFVGALCLIIPLFLTRVLAVFLIVPGLRHLSIRFFKAVLYQRLTKAGGFSFMKFGGGMPGGADGSQPGAAGMPPWNEAPQERDATVVDITPLEISHGPSKKEPTKE
jgi:UPF0716 protein FxsA